MCSHAGNSPNLRPNSCPDTGKVKKARAGIETRVMAEHMVPDAARPSGHGLTTARTCLRWISDTLASQHPSPMVPGAARDLQCSASQAPDEMDWSVVLELMLDHRLAILAAPGLATMGTNVPVRIQASLARFRALTSRMNAANLLTMRQVIPRFAEAGVAVLAFKGPIIQHVAYGSLFVRPSSDLDLLVDRSDYRKSGLILESCGYQLADECRSAWWTTGLGEQHFIGGSSASVTVDLHHRLQQPGCPLPKVPERFLAQRRTVIVGGQPLPTLSAIHGQLLSAMSFVKALHHREPAARYAIDLTALGRGQTDTERRDLWQEASRQGLTNTLALTQRSANLLLPDLAQPGPGAPILATIPDTQLWDMILSPRGPTTVWPKRRTVLQALYDEKRDFPLGLAQMAGSELLRQASTRTGSTRA